MPYIYGPKNRIPMKRQVELKSCMESGRLEAGCDEAGRGPLAGPVYAAAVILPEDFRYPLLDDSKRMTARAREELRPIIEKEAVSWAVVSVSAEEIDEMNILAASLAGMRRAVEKLSVRPDYLLIDGNRFRPFGGFPYSTVVHGDAIYASIAAASVLAKTYRDDFMRALAREWPMYGWDRNMGYPTKEHVEALRKFGPSPWHRRTFHVAGLEKDPEETLFGKIND